MHRLLMMCLALFLLQGCDRFNVAVRNETHAPISVQFVFKAGAECSTYQPIALRPGKVTATRCSPDSVELIKVRQGQRRCDISRDQAIEYYRRNRLGSPLPIHAC